MSPLKVVLIADTHGYLHPEVARVVRRCDICVHAGDIGGVEVLQALHPRRAEVIAVVGNNDTRQRWPEKDWGTLMGLSEQQHLELPGGVLSIVHGHRQNPVAKRHTGLRNLFPDSRAVVYGHSHRQVIDQSHDPWVLNPGAAGRSRTYGGAACLVLTAGKRVWRVESFRTDN